jgi:hypothetical protein
MKTKLTYLADHDQRLIYLNGEKSAIENDWLLLFNHGGTNDELEWIFDDRACFYTNEKKLLSGLTSVYFHRLLNEAEAHGEAGREAVKGLKGGVMPRAKELAKETISGMEKESNKPIYLALNQPYKNLSVFGMGTIETNDEKSFSKGAC